MGQFSWCTSDTRKSIPCTLDGYKGAPEVVYLLNPFGAPYVEKDYNGYGVFGGHDVYDLVVDWNREYLTVNNLEKPERDNWSDGEQGDIWFSSAMEKYELMCDAIVEYAAGASDEYIRAKYGPSIGVLPDGSDWKRCLGIHLACNDSQHVKLRYPIKIVENPCVYEVAEISPQCPYQGCFYSPSKQAGIDRAFDRLKDARVYFLETSFVDAVAIEYKGIVFDEWTVDKETGGVYGEMCKCCADKFADVLKDELSNDGGVGACSVKDCDTVGMDDDVEMFYVDFKPELIVPLDKEMVLKREFELLVDRLFEEFKGQFEREENETELGEPQAWVSLSNGRSIEVTLEQDGLEEDEYFYSVRLHCNETEYDNHDFNRTCGVIDSYCTDKADIEEVRDLIENAVRCNERYPVAEHSRAYGSTVESDKKLALDNIVNDCESVSQGSVCSKVSREFGER